MAKTLNKEGARKAIPRATRTRREAAGCGATTRQARARRRCRQAMRRPRAAARRGVPRRKRRAKTPTRASYVYCIIKSERLLRFGPLGIGVEPADVHTVHFGDIAAVVSNTPMVVQDPTRENVLRAPARQRDRDAAAHR